MTRRKRETAQPEADAAPMKRAGDSLPAGEQRGVRAFVELAAAYKALFSGSGGREEAEIVLTDLASYSGFFMVCERGTPSDLLRETEGMRTVFARIYDFLNLTGDEARRLHEAARAEAQVNSSEGQL